MPCRRRRHSAARSVSRRDGVDGTVCALEPEAVCRAIRELIREPQRRAAYGHAAEARRIDCGEQKKLLEELLWK